MAALHSLVQSGKVRYIGASSMFAWELAEYQHVAEKNGWTKFVAMQNSYSALVRVLLTVSGTDTANSVDQYREEEVR